MKKWKILTAVLCAALLSICLTACGGGQGGQSASASGNAASASSSPSGSSAKSAAVAPPNMAALLSSSPEEMVSTLQKYTITSGDELHYTAGTVFASSESFAKDYAENGYDNRELVVSRNDGEWLLSFQNDDYENIMLEDLQNGTMPTRAILYYMSTDTELTAEELAAFVDQISPSDKVVACVSPDGQGTAIGKAVGSGMCYVWTENPDNFSVAKCLICEVCSSDSNRVSSLEEMASKMMDKLKNDSSYSNYDKYFR